MQIKTTMGYICFIIRLTKIKRMIYTVNTLKVTRIRCWGEVDMGNAAGAIFQQTPNIKKEGDDRHEGREAEPLHAHPNLFSYLPGHSGGPHFCPGWGSRSDIHCSGSVLDQAHKLSHVPYFLFSCPVLEAKDSEDSGWQSRQMEKGWVPKWYL